MILIVGQKAFIVILRKPVLLYSERQETALIAPELLRKRSSLIVPQIVPHRAHPELLHIRPYSRAAETANKALKALILKRRPPFFARHDDALALFAKPRQKIIVELVAVRYGRKVGIRVDGVNDKAEKKNVSIFDNENVFEECGRPDACVQRKAAVLLGGLILVGFLIF